MLLTESIMVSEAESTHFHKGLLDLAPGHRARTISFCLFAYSDGDMISSTEESIFTGLKVNCSTYFLTSSLPIEIRTLLMLPPLPLSPENIRYSTKEDLTRASRCLPKVRPNLASP